jgi:hypothetical protein
MVEPGMNCGSAKTPPRMPRETLGSMGIGCKGSESVSTNITSYSRTRQTHRLRLLLCIQFAETVVQFVAFSHQHNIVSPCIPPPFIDGQLRLFCRDSRQQSVLLDKRQQRNTLPCHLLAVHIDFKVGGIEIQNGRIFLRHKELIRLGKMFATMQTPGNDQIDGWMTSRSCRHTLQLGTPPSTARTV